MDNTKIELELISRFGFDKTIIFCKMITVMYDIMYKDAYERDMDLIETGYDYERDWWNNKYNELANLIKSYN